MYKPVVLITGASGFIGSHLLPFLLARDYCVIGLSRKKQPAWQHSQLQWIQHLDEIRQPIDYVINLAGESIGQGRWSVARKRQLLQSRLDSTRQLYEYLERYEIQPQRIISTSAVGYYGIDPDEQWNTVCTEHSPPQPIFMSELCARWEQQALSYSQQDTKIIRLGVVFAGNGGILPQMLRPIRWNLVGKIGHGRQPVTWVHVQDVLRAIEFLMHKTTSQQVFNVVAPELSSQAQFVHVAAPLLKRKPLMSLPGWVMKYLLGEQSQLILNGQYVQPKALQEAGFKFEFPTLKEALRDILHRPGIEH